MGIIIRKIDYIVWKSGNARPYSSIYKPRIKKHPTIFLNRKLH